MSNKKYNVKDIWLLIDSCLGEIIVLDYYNNKRQLKDGWIKPFRKKLKWDCSYEKAYIPLPARVISLDDDAGLHEIAPVFDVTTPWILQKNGAAGVFSSLESANVGPGRFVCRMEGNRVWVDGFKEYDIDNCVVVIRMVSSITGYKDNEQLLVPDTMMEGRLLDAIAKRLDEVRQTAEKEITDGNPNTP